MLALVLVGEAEVRKQRRALTGIEVEGPAARRGELPDHCRVVVVDQDEPGRRAVEALLDVLVQPVEPVGPHCAVRAGAAHVVHQHQLVVVAEHLAQRRCLAVHVRQRVVLNRHRVAFMQQGRHFMVDPLALFVELAQARRIGFDHRYPPAM